MRLFTGIGKKNSEETVQIKCLEKDVLENALLYAEHLDLPEPSGKAIAYLTEQKKKSAYCIRFLSDGTKAGDLDAGYLAGQVAAFLHFQGNTGIRIHRIQENGRDTGTDTSRNDTPWKMRCRAILTSGESEHSGRRKKRMRSQMEPGIYTEKRENWNEELLAYTKLQYPGTYRRLHSSYKDGWIHFSEKRPVGLHSFADAFDAGMAAAQIMAAAEMLWVELELTRKSSDGGADYLFSVRRKEIVPLQAEEFMPIPDEKILKMDFGKETEKETEKESRGRTSVRFGAGMTAGVSC